MRQPELRDPAPSRIGLRARRAAAIAALALCCVQAQAAIEDMDFIAEHLTEVGMDNRLLTLPIWFAGEPRPGKNDWQIESSYQWIDSGGLRLEGAGFGWGLRRAIGDRWTVGGFLAFDRSDFGSATTLRPVAPLFSAAIPLDLPADASLTNLRGHLQQAGLGLAATWRPARHRYAVTAAIAYFDVRQQDYRVDYVLTSGASSGTAGTLDYSAAFPFWIPTIGIAWRFPLGAWEVAPRLQAGVPLPRYGWRGRMTGPGFDVSGNTEAIGNGKHMGDAFAGLGLAITYRPWQLSLDVGTLINQRLVEPHIHKGVAGVWMVNLRWQH